MLKLVIDNSDKHWNQLLGEYSDFKENLPYMVTDDNIGYAQFATESEAIAYQLKRGISATTWIEIL